MSGGWGVCVCVGGWVGGCGCVGVWAWVWVCGCVYVGGWVCVSALFSIGITKLTLNLLLQSLVPNPEGDSLSVSKSEGKVKYR